VRFTRTALLPARRSTVPTRHLIRGNRDEARTYLQSVADKCRSVYHLGAPYHPAAVAELKRMGR